MSRPNNSSATFRFCWLPWQAGAAVCAPPPVAVAINMAMLKRITRRMQRAPVSDFLGGQQLVAVPHQVIAFCRCGAEDPKDHRAYGAKKAAQKQALHRSDPSMGTAQISGRTFRNR